MTFGWFSKVKSFWNGFLFQENSNISNLISWNIRLFWILSFAKDVLLQKIDCVFVLAIRGLLHLIKNFVLWRDFVFLITLTESFSLKSFLRNDIIMVLSKTCVRFRNRIFKKVWMSLWSNYLFPCGFFWVKDFSSPLWKEFENFSVLGVDFLFVLES